MSVYNSQSSKKWVSFSIAEDSQNLQSLSVNGVFGLVYRPVSTASGKLQDLNINKTRRWPLITGEYNTILFPNYIYMFYMSLIYLIHSKSASISQHPY